MPHAPRATARGRRTATSASASAVVATAVFPVSTRPSAWTTSVGRPLPLTGTIVGDLGLAQSERPTDVVQALGRVLTGNTAVATTALALALVAVLLPRAVARGAWGIAALGALQLGLVLLWAPSIPAFGMIVGTWLLCAALVARPHLGAVVRRVGS